MTNDFNKCDEIRSQLFDLNPADSMTESMKKHLEQCAACAIVYQDIFAINQGLQLMPEHDVSDAVFAQTLAAIQAEKTVSKTKAKGINPQWATGMAASFVLVAVAGLIYNGSISEFQADFNQVPFSSEPESKPQTDKDNRLNRQQPAEKGEATQQVSDEGLGTSVDVIYIEDLQKSSEVHMRSMKKPAKPAPAVKNTLDEIMAQEPAPFNSPLIVSNSLANKPFDAKAVADRMIQDNKENDLSGPGQFRVDSGSVAVTGSRTKKTELKDSEPMSLDQLLQTVKKSASAGSVENRKREAEFEAQRIKVAKEKAKRAELSAEVNSKGDLVEAKERDLDPSPIVQPRRDSKNFGLVASVEENEAIDFDATAGGGLSLNSTGVGQSLVADAAISYLAGLRATDHLSFKSATGYWTNTYLPGDPGMRWIQAQLKQDNGLNLPTVHQNVQPFDYPTNAALGLFLNSDRKTLNETGPTRMRLQVGIQAGQQKGGHRSALNLAVVLDLDQTQPDSELMVESKALLNALLKAKQPTDQISVYLVGVGPIISADDFRHGPIQVALSQIFSQQTKPETMDKDLYQTLSVANTWLKTQDDPNAVLGSSAVLLVAANNELSTASDIESVESLVQQNAIDGITLSTVSLAGIEHRAQLERLALMGQGHSRILAGVHDAQRLINQELLVSSRAVARALRLQIKLAEGVQLIDVLDSYSLDEAQAQKVRDAEQSLDQRMAKNLGITADRGQDDDGIQIMIPSYFAGDTHVILLDVLVKNAGPVAEVSAKYKDLIYLKNATSQKNLHLSTGQNDLGPLELNVMKNVLAHRLSQSVKQASLAIRTGNHAQAVVKLDAILELYQAMRHHIPAWKSDAEMMQDESIIQQYLQLLNSQSSINPKQYQLIADAMSFMSWRKLISHSP